MTKNISILKPQLLHISDNRHHRYGANQIWYPTTWQQKAGCSPTVCSHIMWYLSQTRENCRSLCSYDGSQKDGFVKLMEDVWKYVTPGVNGVNISSIFTEGAIQYGKNHHVELTAVTLEIPSFIKSRPSYNQIIDFLTSAFEDNLPVAFLNLSNGTLTNLDNWHWVTLISLQNHGVEMYDQWNRVMIDLERWSKTTALGGALVVLKPVE